ncbi:MAG: hypothetical protein JO101_00715 [Candidatus Eremiobacteraeota bacterium]|nr:hypothetical protein [Candidatus Eremiobacteraeota bacterium]MBV8353816.1 hypothetical protein [Candidatus Eremiobacteraeota bacterium]
MPLRIAATILAFFLMPITLIDCSSHSSMLPATRADRAQSLQVASGSFSELVGKNITAADIESHIDVQVTGADRDLARRLMRMMPKNMRGDFVYFGSPGHIVSNKLALRDSVLFAPETASSPTPTPAIGLTAANRRTLDFSNSCSPPHPFAGSGPYIRAVSQCGVTAEVGYVTLACSTTQITPQETGDFYDEIRGGSGSLAEGGLQYNSDTNIQPYHRTKGTYDSGTYVVGGVRYQCGTPMGIFSGVLPDGSEAYTAVGIPTESPSTNYISPNNVTWTNSTWGFWPQPGDYASTPGNDGNGFHTPCTACSISMVTSIAQSIENLADGSFLGIDFNSNTLNVHREQNEMGQIVEPCDQAGSSATCTIMFNTNSSTWFGGYQYYPNSTVVLQNATSGYPYEVYQGINLAGAGVFSSAGAFTDPAPPSTIEHDVAFDCTDAGLIVAYYPGDTNYFGSTVPPNIEQIFSIRAPLSGCAQ